MIIISINYDNIHFLSFVNINVTIIMAKIAKIEIGLAKLTVQPN
jgi:hypothetical protein